MKLKLFGYYMLPNINTPIPFDFADVFDTKFMKRYTHYKSFEQFLSNGQFGITKQKDFEDLPEDKMDAYVHKSTKFDTWQEMIDAATDRYIKRNVKKKG